VNAELQRFVRECLGRNLSREAIRGELLKAGWGADEIEAAMRAYAEADFPVPVPRRRPYLNARDAFLYLVLFATLYASAINACQVLFALIERWLPDAAQRARDLRAHGAGFRDWVRGATAGLIIAFPIFLVLSRVIGREVAREPEKRGSGIRKWLTYITLFVAALVLIGDLTVLVARVLAGELPPRFVLKVLVVFLIAGTVFSHYLGELRREEREASAPMAPTGPLVRLAAGALFAVMITGLLLSGSPRQERWRQFDTQRVDALQRISIAIQNHHDARHRLPDSLGALLQLPNGVTAEALVDPATGAPYGYRTIDSLAYELCAEFQTADAAGEPSPLRSDFWKHGPGRACFHLEVVPRQR
jgi:hypothetical protein